MVMVFGAFPSQLYLGYGPSNRYSSYYHRKKRQSGGIKLGTSLDNLTSNFRDITGK